jgi:hypothetical protein
MGCGKFASVAESGFYKVELENEEKGKRVLLDGNIHLSKKRKNDKLKNSVL